MENASKALIMVATVLVGVMILSLIAYLISQFGGTSSQISEQLAATQIQEFNAQFEKYENIKSIKAHDIVSIANLAKENNINYYGDLWENSINDLYYIHVTVIYSATDNKFEQKSKDDLQEFLKENSLENDTTTRHNKSDNIYM